MRTDAAEGAAHGTALTERVIGTVRRDPGASALEYRSVPWVTDGVPAPLAEERLAGARFPSGRPLSPSLRAWLAYDTSLFARHDWFDEDGGFAPRTLPELVGDEYGGAWEPEFALFAERFPECFLLPGGSDSRRFLAVAEPDGRGEYPVLGVSDNSPWSEERCPVRAIARRRRVLVAELLGLFGNAASVRAGRRDATGNHQTPPLALDFDDLPCVSLMYPGFDVYAADTAGLLGFAFETYSGLIGHPVYGRRMREHARHCFDGVPEAQFPFV
ncbi:hypothetical protein JNUCC64_31565 [Streptomyces sp. JNUCC 64]